MTSKISKILADNEKYKNNQVINRNISELWNSYRNFKAKFHAHNAQLEQFTLKVLKLSFFSNPKLNEKIHNNHLKSRCLKSRKTNIKGQFALIKKAISIHLRSLQIEQQLYEENQYLKELLNNSYKIVIKEKNSPAIYEIKNVKVEEKCFKNGLEYILHELEDVSNKTLLKTKRVLEAGNDNDATPQYINEDAVTENIERPRTLPHENATLKKLDVTPEVRNAIKVDTGKSQNFNLQIDFDPSNSQLIGITDISQTVNNNLNSILQNFSNQSLNSLVLDVKPAVYAEAVIDIKDTTDKKEVVQKKKLASAKVRSIENESVIGIDIREKADIKNSKNISALIPNKHLILNYIGLFIPLSFLVQESICYRDAAARKKYDKLILKNEIPCVELQRTSDHIEFKDECLTSENFNSTSIAPGEGENVLRDEREECVNLSEIKAVEFYDIPSNSDIHDYTISWVEQQNEKDFHYIKQTDKIVNDENTKGQSEYRKSIMKRSIYNSRHDDFKDYLKNIITYSEEFYNKRDSSSTINPSKEKKRKRVINFPSSSFAESSYAGKYKNKNILEHKKNYSNYKLPKMPDMNKTYQIVFQQNMPQGFSLKFVKSSKKDVSTLIVSNRYPTSKPNFPKPRLYKR